MADELTKLKEIGVREVAKKTHIECVYIAWIIDKDFEKLKKSNVKGLVKVIEREFDVDLSLFLEEFEAYKKEHCTQAKCRAYTKTVINSFDDTHIIPKKKDSIFSIFWIFPIILLLAAAAIWYFKLYQGLPSFMTIFNNDKNKSAVYSNLNVVEKAKEKLNSVKPIVAKEPTSSKEELKQDENSTLQEASEENISSDSNSSADLLLKEEGNISKEQNQIVQPEKSVLKIIPKEKVWIGIINLKTGSKKSVETDEEFDTDISDPELILTGHGLLKIEFNGKIKHLTEKKPARFLIKDGKITQISYEEFLKLNGDKPW